LVGPAGQYLFGDHRVKDIFYAVAVFGQKLEVEFCIVKDLDDRPLFKDRPQFSEFDALADRDQDVVLAVRKLHGKKPAVTSTQAGRLGVAPEVGGRGKPLV